MILQQTELMFLQIFYVIITIKSQKNLKNLGKPSKFQVPKCDMKQFSYPWHNYIRLFWQKFCRQGDKLPAICAPLISSLFCFHVSKLIEQKNIVVNNEKTICMFFMICLIWSFLKNINTFC